MKKNIVLLGTYYEQSHGDALLFDCVKHIYMDLGKKYNIDMNIKYVDILKKSKIDYTDEYEKNVKSNNKFREKLKKIKVLYKIVKQIKNNREIKQYKKYFKEKFKNMDLIVIVGGGLFKYNVRTNFFPIFEAIILTAEKMNIPVIFNAVGIEGTHNKNDKSFKRLEKIINKDIVKMCSTRDQIEILKSYIHNPNILCKKVADTGVWTSEALNIKKDVNSNLIGLNVITPHRFLDYGKEIKEKELLSFWENIITKLKEKNYEIKLFTNGMLADYKFALKIANQCNLSEDEILKNPTNEDEMVNNISKFKGIIANRLHTCIASYSLDIPVIGIAWNDKLLYWGETINLKNRFFDYDKIEPNKIIEELEFAIKEGYNNKFRDKFKNSIYDYLEESIKLLK